MFAFRQYLQEDAVSSRPLYKPLSLEDAASFFNDRCKNAKWMLDKDSYIYRGDTSNDTKIVITKTGFASVNPALTERKSTETENYYTIIIDNHPDFKDFPKRFRSFIGTTDKDHASQYGITKILIPSDTTKIGVVSEKDIWDVKITIANNRGNITMQSWNSFYRHLGIKESFESFKEFDERLKDGDRSAIRKLEHIAESFLILNEDDLDELKYNFLETIFKAYAPDKIGFKWYTTKNLPHDLKNKEVWVSGPLLIVYNLNDIRIKELKKAVS